jgi:hypothetical protein
MRLPARRLVLFAVLIASVAAGCNVFPGAPQPVSGPLVTVSTRGGECPAGPCGSTVVVERSGRIHSTQPTAAELGTAPADVVGALDAAILTADFGAIKARPFTGECPVNFDGQEVIYEFSTPSGPQRIASCEVEVDPNHPLFVAVERALAITNRAP